MFASHHGCLVVLCLLHRCLKQRLIPRVQPSECQKYTEKTRKPPLTLTHVWAFLPSFPEFESIAPSSAPMTAPVLLSTATKTLPDVRFRSSLLALSSVILVASAANLRPSLAPLLNCSSTSSFLNLCSIRKKISNVPLNLLMYFFSVLQANPLSKVHLNLRASFFTDMTPEHFFCCAQCNIVTLGRRLPLQPSAVGNRSLMWPYHITGTPGCSTPLMQVALNTAPRVG